VTASPWTDRTERIARLLRAPLNFIRFPSYRAAVYRGLELGEAIALRKVDPSLFDEEAGPDRRQTRLDLLWRRRFPAINIVAPGAALSSLDADPSLSLACDLARAGAQARLVATAVSTAAIEAPLRRRLQATYGLPLSAQGRIEIVDGLSSTVACGPDDLFVVLDPRCETIARAALAEAGCEDALRLGPARPGLAEDLLAELGDRQALAGAVPDPAASFDRISALGLRYRVLQAPPADLADRIVCLFVHFDPEGRIDPHVRRYLSALKACGLDLVLVTSCALHADEFAAVSPLLLGAISRENLGLDFSGWALALELFPQLAACRGLVIANDSVYGPVGDLESMISRMQATPCALWGATRNYEIAEHIQSWFVWFRPQALRSPAFSRFWSEVLPLSDKQAIIETYEIPLQKTFEQAGLAVGAAVDLMLLQVANGNPTMHPWRRLLDQGCPFVKVQLLRDDPVRSDLKGWTVELSARGYPVRLILDHLSRVAPHAAGLNQR
jgi:hypothetical protein